MTRCPAHGNRIQLNPYRAVNLFGATPQPDCRRTVGHGVSPIDLSTKPGEAHELLDQHPLRANAVDRLQQQGQEQLLGRDRGPAALGVELAEGRVEPIKGLIRQPPHLPQGMGGRDR